MAQPRGTVVVNLRNNSGNQRNNTPLKSDPAEEHSLDASVTEGPAVTGVEDPPPVNHLEHQQRQPGTSVHDSIIKPPQLQTKEDEYKPGPKN